MGSEGLVALQRGQKIIMDSCSLSGISEEEWEESPYLCKLFGDDGRFVEFVNLTSRPVRLTSRLQMESLSNMSWSTSVIIEQGQKHKWRFLGDSPNLSLYFLSMLPDPYSLARRNSYYWTVEYLDTLEEDRITFDDRMGTLRLDNIRELQAGETETVYLRREKEAVAPLKKLTLDKLVGVKPQTEEGNWLEAPQTLQNELSLLSKSYEEIERKKWDPCKRCGEMH